MSYICPVQRINAIHINDPLKCLIGDFNEIPDLSNYTATYQNGRQALERLAIRVRRNDSDSNGKLADRLYEAAQAVDSFYGFLKDFDRNVTAGKDHVLFTLRQFNNTPRPVPIYPGIERLEERQFLVKQFIQHLGPLKVDFKPLYSATAALNNGLQNLNKTLFDLNVVSGNGLGDVKTKFSPLFNGSMQALAKTETNPQFCDVETTSSFSKWFKRAETEKILELCKVNDYWISDLELFKIIAQHYKEHWKGLKDDMQIIKYLQGNITNVPAVSDADTIIIKDHYAHQFIEDYHRFMIANKSSSETES
ncbi:unnamed protein product [Periconia digitata]|uniref:Uncharacterized protein n=1 Tax=Periconia digitata TaxID=1303443 RepID=A0A9W4XLR3_9PLEO|nr:unnamed protein product [Periconia digitata]